MCSCRATCFCCGYVTLEDRNVIGRCPLCKWPNINQYNGLVYVPIISLLNKEQVSLLEGQRNFTKNGTCFDYSREEDEEEDVEIPYEIDPKWHKIRDFNDIRKCVEYYVEHSKALEYWNT
jgi:hypothetical protein